MARIGIIAAMKPELEILCESIENCEKLRICGMTFYLGQIHHTEVALCQCGVGKVHAAMASAIMLSELECRLLLNTGIAGGIGLNTGDVVIASSLSYHDFDATAFGYAYGQVPGLPKEFTPGISAVVAVKAALNKLGIPYVSCPVYSGDQFISSLQQLKNIAPGAMLACEMEGAAVAQAAVCAGADFIVLRYISDCIGQENQIADYLRFEREMAERSAKICLQIMYNL